MEELLAALKRYFDLIDNPEDMDDWEYLELFDKAEDELRSFIQSDQVDYKLPDFLTKGVTK